MFAPSGIEFRGFRDTSYSLTDARANCHPGGRGAGGAAGDICLRSTTVFLSSPCAAHPSRFIIHAQKERRDTFRSSLRWTTPAGRGFLQLVTSPASIGTFLCIYLFTTLAPRRQLRRRRSEAPPPWLRTPPLFATPLNQPLQLGRAQRVSR